MLGLTCQFRQRLVLIWALKITNGKFKGKQFIKKKLFVKMIPYLACAVFERQKANTKKDKHRKQCFDAFFNKIYVDKFTHMEMLICNLSFVSTPRQVHSINMAATRFKHVICYYHCL